MWKTQKEYIVMMIIIIALGTVTKGLIQEWENFEIRRRVETIQTTELLRSARIPGRVMETCCRSESSGKSFANAGVKNSQWVE